MSDIRIRVSLIKEDAPYATKLVQIGKFDEAEFKKADVLVVSPGVSLVQPSIVAAREAGVEIIGDIELFARSVHKPIVGITGSNGKSTVTRLTEALFEAAGVTVLTGGNIGRPALDLLNEGEPDYYLLELSSFQLETTSHLAAEVAAILNIYPDHMDRYHDIDSYAAAKVRIAKLANTIILNRDDSKLASFARRTAVPQVITFGLNEPKSETDFGLGANQGFRPNVFVDIEPYLTDKLRAMDIYASELGEFPFPRSHKAILALATLRGAASGFKAAEAFELLRERS